MSSEGNYPNLPQVKQSILENPQVGGDLITGDNIQNFIINQPTPPKPTGIPQNIPYIGATSFVGRTEELETLHQQLQRTDCVAISAITGMGGVGKTELAVQYALQHLNNYSGGVCWLQARASDISAQVVKFAQSQLDLTPQDGLDPVNRVAFCWRHWIPGDVLVVLDDLADYGQIKPFLPPKKSQFKVLITTRSQFGRNIQQLSLDVLTLEAALELLELFVGERVAQQPNIAQELCQWLGFLPLGLELVGQYLVQQPDLPLTEMLQRLKAQRLTHNALLNIDDSTLTAQRGVSAAFELSWESLDEKAQELSCLLSLFASAPIPWFLVVAIVETEEELRELEDTRATGEENPDVATSLCKLAVLYRHQGRYTEAESHCLKALEIYKRLLGDEHPHIASSLNVLAAIYQAQGRYKEAEPVYTLALKIHKHTSGEEELGAVDILSNFASLYYVQGRYDEAESLYIQALECYRDQREGEDFNKATLLNNFALLYSTQGRYQEAELLYTQALELYKSLLGDEHPYVAMCWDNLATLHREQDHYEEAESLYLQALELRKQTLGEVHPEVAKNLNNLALLYSEQDRYDEAEPLYLQSLEIDKRLLGEEHPSIAICLDNLGSLYQKQGRYDEAEPLHVQALELTKRLLGEGHPSFRICLSNLTALYHKQKRYDEAELLYLQTVELTKHQLGEDRISVAMCLDGLTSLYVAQHRYSEAEPVCQQVLKICEQELGVEHPRTLTIRKALSRIQFWKLLKTFQKRIARLFKYSR